MTSLHAHCGPVDFLLSTSCTLTSDLLRKDSISTDGEGDVKEDEGEQKVEHSHQDLEAPPPRPEKPRGFVLQYRLRSTSQLPGKLLSAQSEPPAEPPDHSPEDGSIYTVSEDPDVWVRGRAVDQGREGETRRSRVTCTAIFSGGRGHRRLGGSSAGDPEENTLLVWQLPLSLQ